MAGLKEHKEDIIDLYVNKNMKVQYIANLYKCTTTSIYRILKEEKVKMKTISESKKKYKLNEHCFDEIDTEEKAYVLGFLYADGCNMIKSHKIKITLALYDREILEKIRNVFETNAPIIIKEGRKISNSEYYGSPTATLRISSVYLSNRLCELGVLPNKTYILKFPDFLRKDLVKHFVRGYFDGDGSITLAKRGKPKICIASSKIFLQNIKDICDNNQWISHIYSKKRCDDAVGIFEIQAQDSVKNFLDWIYLNSKIYCERKYNRYYSYFYQNIPIKKYEKIDNKTLMDMYGYEDCIIN